VISQRAGVAVFLTVTAVIILAAAETFERTVRRSALWKARNVAGGGEFVYDAGIAPNSLAEAQP
jgi:hypothetical protein